MVSLLFICFNFEAVTQSITRFDVEAIPQGSVMVVTSVGAEASPLTTPGRRRVGPRDGPPTDTRWTNHRAVEHLSTRPRFRSAGPGGRVMSVKDRAYASMR